MRTRASPPLRGHAERHVHHRRLAAAAVAALLAAAVQVGAREALGRLVRGLLEALRREVRAPRRRRKSRERLGARRVARPVDGLVRLGVQDEADLWRGLRLRRGGGRRVVVVPPRAAAAAEEAAAVASVDFCGRRVVVGGPK